MENNPIASLMIMYEDESVDIRYENGARLQLSPCACEFMLVKPSDLSGHPLQTRARVRQRTRFTISTYKEMIMAALAFRNKYASQPYLPEELIPAEHKKPFFTIVSDINWPEWSSCNAEFGHGGQTIIRSEEGRAVLTLSPSCEEFSVEFTCNLSHTQYQHHNDETLTKDSQDNLGTEQPVSKPHSHTDNVDKDRHEEHGNRRHTSTTSRSSIIQPKPEGKYKSTTVVQHHSCCSVAPVWSYPLSLARHFWKDRLCEADDVRAEGSRDMAQSADQEEHCHLPQALPLTCLSPHWHRWMFTDPLDKIDVQDLPTEPVKVMWCHGVTYRILSGAVSVIEVAPGDGSVIRSNGVLNTYFTHHKPELLSGKIKVKEVTYHLKNLPPDVPGQLYSVRSVVSRASRILSRYSEAKQLLKLPATLTCLQEVGHKPAKVEENVSCPLSPEHYVNVTQAAENLSDLVATELEKIKRFNFLLDNTHLLASEKPCAPLPVESGSEEVTCEAMNENCIAEALQRTSKTIEDIDALVYATMLMSDSTKSES